VRITIDAQYLPQFFGLSPRSAVFSLGKNGAAGRGRNEFGNLSAAEKQKKVEEQTFGSNHPRPVGKVPYSSLE